VETQSLALLRLLRRGSKHADRWKCDPWLPILEFTILLLGSLMVRSRISHAMRIDHISTRES